MALSRDGIVEAAIEILDHDGEDALTFRALAARLATGSGALYWHVANKNELLAAGADHVIARVVSDVATAATPQESIRAIALGLFDALEAHPWVGAYFTYAPWTALMRIFESVGAQVQALGVPESRQFDCASALVHYILGVAGQNAANARLFPGEVDRSAFLAGVADTWTRHDIADCPFVHQVAAQLRDHDDREQFLTGIDLILAGIEQES
ncbi:AcrR family transcriptional regulator [Mycolicibacterium sp. BK634]|uniref:TetR/AcrR family transcriptional regulator n=1 Tax=Mycolicibacterium sp. BK634 TaxID=2587099 RepID=UPI00161537D2|nr:TetR family transcriptional regulator [Mycolicibacterium sp. BK634]MBB3751241.1 AcrR family transcriptional regulator [Mycolicibacterium sp. BK634]